MPHPESVDPPPIPAPASRRVVRFAWTVVGWNLLVILWGAWVRLSGSGAGCGSHWPLCDGEVIPQAPSVEKLIEFTHRATSGLALVAVVALAVAVFRAFPKASAPRRAAALSVALILIEALLGAGLVLLELVANDESAARALVMPLHLANTFLLLGALALTAHTAAGGAPFSMKRVARGAPVWIALLALFVLSGASGAVAALGDTLFPPRSLGHALEQELSPASHALLRFRLAHPALALAAAVVALWIVARANELERGAGWRRALGVLVLGQIALGTVNVLLLAPAALQLAHLLVADLIWMAAVIAAAEAVAGRAAPPELAT